MIDQKLALHWQIILGLVLGVLFGIVAAINHWGQFTQDWIAPFGTIFVNLLKLIAVPLVMASLVTGVASLADLTKLSRIGGRTITIYLMTTVVAIFIGLVLVNSLQPGLSIPDDVTTNLQATYEEEIQQRTGNVQVVKERGPLQPLVDIVPQNIISASGNNRNMLQVVFFALLVGIGLILVRNERTDVVLQFFQGLNDVIIKLVDVIMLIAPIGVFALIAGTITSIAGDNLLSVLQLLRSLGFYALVVCLGLMMHVAIVYGSLIHFISPLSLKKFFQGIAPAQLLAFSTSSSAATLPVTMECVEENLNVKKEVASFVLPLGATINLDGTAMYQSIAAVFIAQALGMDLNFTAQLTIVLTALLASIGAAPVPGSGLIMLVIILEAIGVPSGGIALILGVDRILDMLRTTANVTGDATVSVLINASETKISR
ncbi:dicarboxylate/amino acid:cation symporter [Woeseiaceae bacterium]|jgi:Na+/H+-dicarboxylate symporter|nr:dicarboxylate/amino acid:cation symporter [Woeseiaceae bacterium]